MGAGYVFPQQVRESRCDLRRPLAQGQGLLREFVGDRDQGGDVIGPGGQMIEPCHRRVPGAARGEVRRASPAVRGCQPPVGRHVGRRRPGPLLRPAHRE